MKKKIVLIIALIVAVILLILLWNTFKTLITEDGRQEFKDVITNIGIKGYLIIIGLTIAQVFVAILPGEPVELLAGMCYGSIGGLITIYIGVFISNCIIFWLVRKVGKTSIYNFLSKEKVEKIEKSKFFNSKNIESILLIMFAIPGTPKDLLTYIGALLPIDAKKFIIISTLIRFPSIITSTVVGANLVIGNIWFGIIVYVLTFIISLIILHYYSRKQEVKEIMDI